MCHRYPRLKIHCARLIAPGPERQLASTRPRVVFGEITAAGRRHLARGECRRIALKCGISAGSGLNWQQQDAVLLRQGTSFGPTPRRSVSRRVCDGRAPLDGIRGNGITQTRLASRCCRGPIRLPGRGRHRARRLVPARCSAGARRFGRWRMIARRAICRRSRHACGLWLAHGASAAQRLANRFESCH